jgi:hypothetical protein
VNVKVEPRPTSLCTQILPPWSPTNFRESASPSRVPSASDDSDAGTFVLEAMEEPEVLADDIRTFFQALR